MPPPPLHCDSKPRGQRSPTHPAPEPASVHHPELQAQHFHGNNLLHKRSRQYLLCAHTFQTPWVSYSIADTLHGHSPKMTREKPRPWKLNRSTCSNGNLGQPCGPGTRVAPQLPHLPSSKCNTLQRFLTPPHASVPLCTPSPMPTHVHRSSRGFLTPVHTDTGCGASPYQTIKPYPRVCSLTTSRAPPRLLRKGRLPWN